MENQATISEFDSILSSRGVSRRSFMKLCGAVAAAAGLSQLATPRVAQAMESVIGATKGNLYPVIWIEGASCTGCTESFAQVETPDVATVVLDMISLNYSETLSAAAGHSMEEAKDQTIAAGNYILVYEGAVQKGWDGNALRVAARLEPLRSRRLLATRTPSSPSAPVRSTAAGSPLIPNPSNAMGVEQYLREVGIDTPVVNVPGCPVNPEWVMSVLVDVVLLKDPGLLKLNDFNMPAGIFDQTIHDNCERRGHFENGEFVYQFGSEEEAKGYCLYPLGCRGPQTKSNCGVTMWNSRRSWCVRPALLHRLLRGEPEQPGHNWVEVNTPFYKRHRDLRVGGLVFQPGTVALAVTGLVAAALVVHGFGMKATRTHGRRCGLREDPQMGQGASEKAIGEYADPVEGGPLEDEKKN